MWKRPSTPCPASVDLDSKTAVVTGDAGDEALKKAVADAGYQVTDIR